MAEAEKAGELLGAGGGAGGRVQNPQLQCEKKVDKVNCIKFESRALNPDDQFTYNHFAPAEERKRKRFM